MIRLILALIAMVSYCHGFDNRMLHLLDTSENVSIYRGDLPKKNGEFCLNRIFKDCLIYDICLLSKSSEAEDIFLEQGWFYKHPERGKFFFFPIRGSIIDPCKYSKETRCKLLSNHKLDGLVEILECVYGLSKSQNKAIVYIHCKLGKDRTGEVAACYLMQFKGWPYARAIKQSKKIAKRKINHKNINMIRWYAFWLRDIQGVDTVGNIEGR